MSATAPANPPHPHTLPPHAESARLPMLLLASRSPRRRELLTGAGIEHIARHPGIDDTMMRPGFAHASPAHIREGLPEQWAAALAYLKAATAIHNRTFSEDEHRRAAWVLGADTVVVKKDDDDPLIGTPLDEADAARILRRLSNGTHEVITGVALVRPRDSNTDSHSHPSFPPRILFTDRATVRVGPLTNDLLDPYLASGQWQGKAGAYNLAERIAGGWPIAFTGDPGTIMGLPMVKLLRILRNQTPRQAN